MPCEWSGLSQASKEHRLGVYCVRFTEKASGKADHLHRAACLATFFAGWVVSISTPDPQTAIVWYMARISDERGMPRVPVLDQDSRWVREYVESGEHSFKSAQRYAKMPAEERKVTRELMEDDFHLPAAQKRERRRRLNAQLAEVRARHHLEGEKGPT